MNPDFGAIVVPIGFGCFGDSENWTPPGLQVIWCHSPDMAVNLEVLASDWKEVFTWWYHDGEVEVRLFSEFLWVFPFP